jgi:hemerythrin-like metal-binding protein
LEFNLGNRDKMLFNKLIWYDEYLSGIQIIDEQHKDIFAAFNKFFASLNAGELDKVILDEFLHKLDAYTITHFDTEEKFMREFNYSKLEEHKEGSLWI